MYIGETNVAGQASNAISGLGEATALSADALKRAVTLNRSIPHDWLDRFFAPDRRSAWHYL